MAYDALQLNCLLRQKSPRSPAKASDHHHRSPAAPADLPGVGLSLAATCGARTTGTGLRALPIVPGSGRHRAAGGDALLALSDAETGVRRTLWLR